MRHAGTILVTVGLVSGMSWYFAGHHGERTLKTAQQTAWQKAVAERQAELAPSSQPKSTPALPGPTLAQETSVLSSKEPITIRETNKPMLAPKLPAIPSAPTVQIASAGSKAPLQDPLARVALSLAGADPEAEEVWAEAINNPELPPHERKDLIEDLNEEGFPDPKNITLEDLPLILARIELIEEHAPHAMDEVNYAAFMEAYKDLQEMLARLGTQ